MDNNISNVDDTFILANYSVLKHLRYHSGFGIKWRADQMRREWKKQYRDKFNFRFLDYGGDKDYVLADMRNIGRA